MHKLHHVEVKGLVGLLDELHGVGYEVRELLRDMRLYFGAQGGVRDCAEGVAVGRVHRGFEGVQEFESRAAGVVDALGWYRERLRVEFNSI